MKTITTLFFFCFITVVSAQNQDKLNVKKLYGRWSVETNFGQNQPIKPFSEGNYTVNSDKHLNFPVLNHFDIGTRYMFSNVFGLKLDYAFDQFENNSNSNSLDFKTKQNRLGLQGVVNLGRLLRFENFTNRFGILTHAGIFVSKFTSDTGVTSGNSEYNGGIMYGISPQLKLTKWLSLTGDFTVLNSMRQHLNWDGSTAATNTNLSGTLYNTTLGFTIYLFNKENQNHADWTY